MAPATGKRRRRRRGGRKHRGQGPKAIDASRHTPSARDDTVHQAQDAAFQAKAAVAGAEGGAVARPAQPHGAARAAHADHGESLAVHAPHHHGKATTARDRATKPGHPTPRRASEPPHGRQHAVAARPRSLYAALDLGTNNCRLLVAEPQSRGFRVVDAFSKIVRLGEGMAQTGRLSDAAMDRAVEALSVCRRKLADRGVERARFIATEACRAAENGETFLARVATEVGLSLEVVSRETEARLAVAGCSSLVDPRAKGVVLFDIGGGSSELVWVDLTRGPRRDPTKCIRAWASLPVGVVTLSERHGGVEVDEAVFARMVEDVSAMLDVMEEGDVLARHVGTGGIHLLGTSGTVTTLAGVHLGLRRYDRRRVDGTWLRAAEVNRMVNKVQAMSYRERVENPCIGADRADLVLAGCAILEAIRRRWPCGRLRVADRGLREGILLELMKADGVWRRPSGRARP